MARKKRFEVTLRHTEMTVVTVKARSEYEAREAAENGEGRYEGSFNEYLEVDEILEVK